MEVLLKNHTLNETYLETILCLTFCVVFDLSYLCKRYNKKLRMRAE